MPSIATTPTPHSIRAANMALPPPEVFGFPYPSWRQGQAHAILTLAGDTPVPRFVLQIAPTGSGKSLTYMSAAILSGARTVILTSTKALQDQLIHDFVTDAIPVTVADMRGKNNYQCPVLMGETQYPTADNGPCQTGWKCTMERDCPHRQALANAAGSQVVITNYALWLAYQDLQENPLGDFDMMVLDEAHDAHNSLSDALTMSANYRHACLRPHLPPESSAKDMTLSRWRSHAMATTQDLKAAVAGARHNPYHHRLLQDLAKTYTALASMSQDTLDNDWCLERVGHVTKIAPVWPAKYSYQLFSDIPQVLLTSATATRKTAGLLGIPDDALLVQEYPHPFPVEGRLITHVPTIRLSFRTTEGELRRWLIRIDQIVRARMDRKGIVHTVSYARRNKVVASSSCADIMHTHDRADTAAVISKFKTAQPPAVLVSPSVTTGYDFPYDQCEYQIIGKIPWPDASGPVAKARAKLDPDYAAYQAMMTLVQAAGRGTRGVDDHCETFVIDDNIQWFIRKYSAFAPGWFVDAFRQASYLPKPPRPLHKPI